MSDYSDFPVPTDLASLDFEIRADLPLVTTSKTTGLPKLLSSTLDYTTPSVGVPTGVDNPYIYQSTKPLGTVFIAVGSVVAFILLGFVVFHLIKSITASSTAKKNLYYEKLAHGQYAKNNTNAYGNKGSDNSIFNNTEYNGAVTKLPLLSSSRQSMLGFNPDMSSTSYSDLAPLSKHDTTKMFVSPTKEMTYARHGGALAVTGSMSNLAMSSNNGSEVNTSPMASKRHSQVIPSFYIDDRFSNAESSVDRRDVSPLQARPGGEKRMTTPSMYLDDLLDD